MIEGEWVTMNTNVFPTVDLADPYELTEEETEILRKLHRNFVSSQRLQKHIRFLYEKGSMYNVYNGNLIYHGCVPVDKNGALINCALMGNIIMEKRCWISARKSKSRLFGQPGQR